MELIQRIRQVGAWCTICMIISAKADTVVHGPYLQLPSQTSMTVRWRTDIANTGTVFFGSAPANLNQTLEESADTTEHEVTLTGLLADSTYYYAVGYETNILAGDDSYNFQTFPASGATGPVRIWVIGDSGSGSTNARAVYSSYLTYTGTNRTDLFLTLGDNAYDTGTDAEFHNKFFNTYPEVLRTTPAFSCLGNHDGTSADSATQSGPYYDLFSFPAAGECGGTPSGTEAYYSVDFGDVHFICLDSAESDRSTNGAMHVWLQQDLEACTASWIIAYWHHPPYSMGSHDSDTGTEMTEMRSNFLPLLEQHGVDLVFGGHSHVYECTYLMDQHYGDSGSYDFNIHALNQGDGWKSGGGVYVKPSTTKAAHKGTVYVVAGSSGSVTGSFKGDHPAMETALLEIGSVVIDIASNRLDLAFLNKEGNISDSLTMIKGEADYDGDGMSDLWEQDNFRISVQPDGRADADQADNLSEYIAGTDPNDAASFFEIDTNAVDETGFILQWNSVTNRSYNIQWTDLLSSTMVNIQTNILYPQNTYTDALHAARNAGFYRVEVHIDK